MDGPDRPAPQPPARSWSLRFRFVTISFGYDINPITGGIRFSMTPRPLLPLLACLVLPACATLVNGSKQTVTITTDPPGATCRLTRGNETLGAIAATPGSVQVSKSKNDINVVCEKNGYQNVAVSRSPSFGGATFGNILAGGVVGVVVDAASGANYSYPAEVHLGMAATPPATLPTALPTALPTSPAVLAAAPAGTAATAPATVLPAAPRAAPATAPAVIPAMGPAAAPDAAKPVSG